MGNSSGAGCPPQCHPFPPENKRSLIRGPYKGTMMGFITPKNKAGGVGLGGPGGAPLDSYVFGFQVYRMLFAHTIHVIGILTYMND